MAGVDIVRVSYKGGAAAMTDLVGGRVQLSFTSAASASSFVKTGKLRALAVTSVKPSELAPGLPPIASEGLPGYELISTYGVFAPAKTPATVISRLNQGIVKSLQTADLKEKFFKTGAEIVASSPQAFAAVIQSDMSKLGKLIRDAGIKSD